MDGLIVIGILLLGGIAMAAAKKKNANGTGLITDQPVTIDNIRKGVERGWYNALLCRVDGQPAIYLYGIDANGNNYGDTYPISEADWQTLKAEGYSEQQV